MQTDPLGAVDGFNLYAYVGNNPVSWIDPFGLESYRYLLSPCGAPESCGGGSGIEAPIGEAAGLAMTGIILGILDHIVHDEGEEESGTTEEALDPPSNTCPANPNDYQPNGRGPDVTDQLYERYRELARTIHGTKRMAERGFTDEHIYDMMENYSRKVYQSQERTVFAQKQSNGFWDVIIINDKGEIISVVGGKERSLENWKAVERMLNNDGGYSSLPGIL